MPWGAIIGGAAALLGSAMSSDASSNAADTQAQAARDASAQSMAMFQQQRADLAPWRNAGGVALDKILSLLGLDDTGSSTASATGLPWRTKAQLAEEYHASGADVERLYRQQGTEIKSPTARGDDFGSLLKNFSAADLEADPIYRASRAFQLDEAEKTLKNAASARGELDSGVLMKDLLKYGTGILSGLGGDAYNRFNTNKTMAYNMLAPTAQLGQSTGVQLANLGAQLSGQIGSNIIGAGNAQAAGQVGSANAWSTGISGALQAYQNQQLLNRFLGTSAAPAGGAPVVPDPSYTSGMYGLQPPRVMIAAE